MAPSRYAVLMFLMTCGLSGCSTFGGKNTEILNVDLNRDTVRASELTQAGARHYRNGHVKKAKAEFQKAIASDETYGPAHNNLGLLYFDQRDLYQAAWSFQRATEFMPERAEPFNNLGLTFEAAGRLTDAIEMYYSATELEPANPQYLGNLMRARVMRGDRDDTMRLGLKELLFVDTRPDWIGWAEDQLALNFDRDLPQGTFNSEEGDVVPPEVLPVPLGMGPPRSSRAVPGNIEVPTEIEIPLDPPRFQVFDD